MNNGCKILCIETVTRAPFDGEAPGSLPPEERRLSGREKLDLAIIVGTLGGAVIGEFALPDSSPSRLVLGAIGIAAYAKLVYDVTRD